MPKRPPTSHRGHTTLSRIDSQPVSPTVAERLAELAARVEAGEAPSLAYTVVTRDGSISRAWSEPPTVGTLIGAVAVLQAELIGAVE